MIVFFLHFLAHYGCLKLPHQKYLNQRQRRETIGWIRMAEKLRVKRQMQKNV